MKAEQTYLTEQPTSAFENLHTVTPLSMYLAMALFIILPFLGGYIGYVYAPEKIVEMNHMINSSDGDDIRSEYLTASSVPAADPLTITFTTTYTYPDTYAGGRLLTIHYGDGRNETIKNQTQHTYATPGTYKVILEGCNPQVDLFCEQVVLDTVKIEVTPEAIAEINQTKTLLTEDNQSCVVDSDCALITTDCADCTFGTVNTTYLNSFRAEKQRQCALNPPEIMCDMVFDGDIKCIENKCQLVP